MSKKEYTELEEFVKERLKDSNEEFLSGEELYKASMQVIKKITDGYAKYESTDRYYDMSA